MKRLLPLLIACAAFADTAPKQGFERLIDRYEYDACRKLKELVKSRYEIVDMDAGCRCERTDSREWQCDIGFTYLPAPQREE